jgi:hypothetical protein
MASPAAHVVVGLVLSSVGLGTAAPSSAQTSCDPSYPTICIPPATEIGDLDCWEVIVALPVIHDPHRGANDSHGLDGDFDGVGCEWWSFPIRP